MLLLSLMVVVGVIVVLAVCGTSCRAVRACVVNAFGEKGRMAYGGGVGARVCEGKNSCNVTLQNAFSACGG
jgi:hypothetical protein